ncbi:uncharacterized protein LOC117582906 [Drosophila guanche]|uniref:Uncharacterized protein n=1 Tax=Drosophila guanche TaxID=7266 RepID=A0A3B0KC84_DROGU|nr:uncharacterized protein LOC117582906 [Drosophila guanche]SPP81228.1 Hypothetical predicted protein [Drosophila guanche]
MNKTKSSRKSAYGTTSNTAGASHSTNEKSAGSNNAGNRNPTGIEEGDQDTFDGVPFILVDAILLTQSPLTDPELTQIEAKRMAEVTAECDRLLNRLKNTKPPPELDVTSTSSTAYEHDDENSFLEELQQLCIFPTDTEEQDGVEEISNFSAQAPDNPGISRQDTFHIDRIEPSSLSDRTVGGESPFSSQESVEIINQIGDLLVKLQQQQKLPLEEGTSCFFIASIKPDAQTSNCFVKQIGKPASLSPPEIEPLERPVVKSEILIQIDEDENIIPPRKTSRTSLLNLCSRKSRFGYDEKN